MAPCADAGERGKALVEFALDLLPFLPSRGGRLEFVLYAGAQNGQLFRGRNVRGTMKLYLLSLGAGLLVGVIYALINVRSPAPPVIALVGLFGILAGEQIPPLVKTYLRQTPAGHSWMQHQVRPHVFGHLPSSQTAAGIRLAQSVRGPGQRAADNQKKE